MKLVTLRALCSVLFASTFVAGEWVTPNGYKGLKFIGANLDTSGIDSGLTDFYISDEKRTFAGARKHCWDVTKKRGTLLQVKSQEEERVIRENIIDAGARVIGEHLWTDGHSDETGKCTWASSGVAVGGTWWCSGVVWWGMPLGPPKSAYMTLQVSSASESKLSFKTNANEAHNYVCQVSNKASGTRQTCDWPNDVLILADINEGAKFGKNWEKNLELERSFILELALAFEPPNRVAVFSYGPKLNNFYSMAKWVDPDPGRHRLNKTLPQEIKDPSGRMPHSVGISKGLEHLRQEGKDHPGALRKLVLLTNGRTKFNDESHVRDQTAEVDRARDESVILFVVGIGSYASQDELVTLAGGNPSRVFRVSDYNNLQPHVQAIATDLCTSNIDFCNNKH